MRGLRRLASFPAGRRGGLAIEFALGLPILLLGIVGVLEFAMYAFVGGLLESAVLDASRFGITGGAPSGVSRKERVVQILSDRTLGFVDMSKATVTTLIYPTFGDVDKPEPFTDANANGVYDAGEDFTDVNVNGAWDPDMGAAGLGGPGDIVVYRVEYEAPTMTGLFAPIVGTFAYRASVAVRNEPF